MHITTAALALATSLLLSLPGARAQDLSKYPDWGGMWRKPPGVGFQWDETKRPGLAQQAPLTPEYQAVLEERASPTRRPADRAATPASPAAPTACRG